MRRKAAQELKPIQTNPNTAFLSKSKASLSSSDYDQRTPTQPLLFSPTPPSYNRTEVWSVKKKGSRQGFGAVQPTNNASSVKVHNRPVLHNDHSFFTEAEIKSSTVINQRTIDDLFYFPPSTTVKQHPYVPDTSLRNQDTGQTKALPHQRVRTESSVSLSTIRARNLLAPKRWSALFTSKTNTNQASVSSPFQPNYNHSTGLLKRNAKLNSPRFEDARKNPLPAIPSQISQPYSVSAYPGSALSNAVLASGKYVSAARYDAQWIGGDMTGYESEAQKITFSPIERSNSQASLESQMRRATIDRKYEEEHERISKAENTSQMKANHSDTYDEPIEHIVKDEKMRRYELGQSDVSDYQSSFLPGDLSDQSIYHSANESSFMGRAQSYSTCLTQASQRSRSEANISTSALSNDDERSSSKTDTAKTPFPMTQSNSYPRLYTSCTQSTGLSKHESSLIEEWGSRPEGLCIENGDELSTKLQSMLNSKAEQGRQSRLHAWRRHAKSEAHREEALHALMIRESRSKETQDPTPKNPLKQKVSILDFLRKKEEEKIINDYDDCLQPLLNGRDNENEMRTTPVEKLMEDDAKSTYLDSTMDATSVLENDSDSVEIRTAWRERLGHLNALGASLGNRHLNDSVDVGGWEEDQSIVSTEYSLGSIPLSHDTSMTTLHARNQRKEHCLYDEQKGKHCVSPSASVSHSRSETELADESDSFDLCAFLLQRARENRPVC